MVQTVSTLLELVSRELRGLARITATLQDELSPRDTDPLDVVALQSLDVLNQTLDCLATYIARLGALASPDGTVAIDGALDDMPLAALAERLRGGAPRPPQLPVSEIEFF